MERKKVTVKKEEPKPVVDERDKVIFKLQAMAFDLTVRLDCWREFGRLHGPVSSRNDLNTLLLKLKEMGEI